MPVETQKLFSLWDSIKLENFDEVGEIGVNSSGQYKCENRLSEPMSLTACFVGVIQKYGRKLKWFGQEQTSFEHESEGRLLPVDNADLIGRVVTVL